MTASPSSPELYIGLMSGTSLDGIDGVLAELHGPSIRVLHHASTPFPQALRAELLALNTTGADELHRAALAGNALARCYAQVVEALVHTTAADGTARSTIRAIGAHGQTVRHRPREFDGTGYTVQLNNPALLAELTGLTVVADFRSRDVAAGGQGAPLVPAFHQGVFGRAGQTVLVLNIGGISNLSVLGAQGEVRGFDCGPGNALMDHWCQQHRGQAYDAGGQWAASGQVIPQLLQALLAEPFLGLPPPKSTGRDLFNPKWLAQHLAPWAQARPQDIQATLTELTASACAEHVKRYGNESKILGVCGGGALNTHLMQRLQALLPDCAVGSTDAWGLPALQVEAAAFAWLARQALHGQTGSLKTVTGAQGARVLGAIYPA